MIIIFINNEDVQYIKYYLSSLEETKNFKLHKINSLDQIREYFFDNLDKLEEDDYIFVNIFNVIFFENLIIIFKYIY